MTGRALSASERRVRRGFVPGDGILHPAALVAIATLIVNDHILKAAWPGLLTGKLSDFAGLLFFPLLLQGLFEVGLAFAGRWQGPSPHVLKISAFASGLVFASIKLVPEVNLLIADATGGAQSAVGFLTGIPTAQPASVRIAMDPTDLLALPMVTLAYAIGHARCRESTR